jgi:branched-chain amino acid transport system substrate-binding protein
VHRIFHDIIKVLRVTAILGLLGTAAASVSQSQAQSTPTPSRGAAVRIGMLLPLSGSYASGGTDNRYGIEAARSLAATPEQLEIIFADSKADPVTGVNEFRTLTSARNVMGVYVMRGSVGMPINPISRALGISLLGGAGNKDFTAVNPFAFQVWSKSDNEGGFLAQILKQRGYDSAALITVQDDWQGAVSEGFRAASTSMGVAISTDQEVLPVEVDFRSLLLRLARGSRPKAIIANIGANQMGPFLRQAKELKVAAPIYCNFWVAKKDVMEAAGSDTLEGVRFIEMDTDLPYLKRFVAERYSAVPSGATLSAYAATLLFQQTVASNPRIATREDLFARLLEQREITTPDGPIRIIDRRVQFVIKEKIIRDGKVAVM